tara:strand:+ start:1924 stop:4980 length:3057 start_codon:yes stop_codon:yes gene_type:complete
MAFANQTISFHSDAVGTDALIVRSLAGQERLSGMFCFELELVSQDKELKLEDIVAAPARIGIKQKVAVAGAGSASRLREFSGVLTQFEQHEEGQGWISYRATMVPKVSELGEFWRSRIFQGKSAPQIVKEVLTDFGLSASAPKVFGDFHFGDGIADQMRAPTKDQADYPLREYVVQYEESDWDFLARWLEHEGIYFYFENKDQQERVVFSDASTGSEPVSRNPSEATYRYRPQTEAGAVGSSEEEIVAQFLCRQTRAPKEVALNDYNWRDAVRLSTVQKVDDKGVGLQTEYNDHYKNAEQGKALAKVRKEELLCRTQLFYGVSNSRAMRPGKTFSLSEHYRGDWNRDYLLVSVEHVAEQSLNVDGATVTGASYENRFTAIPLDVPFRPERLTEWPAIKGVMHGKIDSSKGAEYADLDEDGCYTVRIPYDPHFDNEEEREAGGASRRMRMAQPFSGMDAGFHFPLRKGTEVILTHIDGDPDRPIIAGAVPNADTGNVGQHDESRNQIVSNSGNRFEIHDTSGSSGFLWQDSSGSVISDQRHRLGSGSGGGDSPGGGGGGAAPPKGKRQAAPKSPPKSVEELAALAEAKGLPGPLSKAEAMELLGRAAAALPQPGAGMVAGEKETGGGGAYQDPGEQTPSDALDAFLAGQAAQDLGGGCYVGDSSRTIDASDIKSLIGSTIAKHSVLGSPGVADYDPNNLGSNLISPAVQGASAAVGAVIDALGLGGGGGGPGANDLLGTVNNFEALAFGSRLRIWLGDTIQINRGDKYTYADVTHDVSYGTGGYGYHHEGGNTNDVSVHDGNASSKSTHNGDSSSWSSTSGDSTSYSQTMGKHDDTSYFLGTKVSFDFKVSAETSTSVALSGENSNSFMLGAKVSTDIFVGLKGSFEVDISGSASLKLAITRNKIFGGIDNEINFPSKQEIDVAKLQLALNETQTILQATTATVAQNNASLSETQAVLSFTNAVLAENEAKGSLNEALLSHSSAKLADSSSKLSENAASLTHNAMSASRTALSGAHIIS